MKKNYTLTFILLCLSVLLFAHGKGDRQLDFVLNAGQWAEHFDYKTDLPDGGTLFLEDATFTFHYYEEQKLSWRHHYACPDDLNNSHLPDHVKSYCDNDLIRHHVFKMNFLNANTAAQKVSGVERSYYHNYFLGEDPSRWKGAVPVYDMVTYKQFYNGIDMVVYSDDYMFKYDYIVHPYADPTQIEVQYEGLDDIYLDDKGNLILKTSFNYITEYAPHVYQMINGKEKVVKADFELVENIVTINVKGRYDESVELIIDPALLASTYSGSNSDNWGYTATYDNDGNMYGGGMVVGNGYPTTTGAYDESYNGGNTGSGSQQTDISLSKFSADGTTLVWSTFLGGSNNELPHSLVVDQNDQLVLFGTTGSDNFPTTTGPAFSGGTNVICGNSIRYNSGSDIVLTKFNATGTALVNSRFFGGSANDGLNTTNSNNLEFNYGDYARGDIEFDGAGNILLASCSYSTTLPGTAGKFQTTNAGQLDGIIAKFSGDLSTHQWTTFYGGSDNDAAYDIELDGGSLIIAGGTQSANFPGMNGLNTSFLGGRSDGYLVRMNTAATSSINGTYLGTNEYDQTFFVDTDEMGNVYTYGHTLGNYPVLANWSRSNAPQFIHKLTADMSTTEYSTTFGRINYVNQNRVNLSPTAFLVDNCENVYCMGWGGTSNSTWNINAGTTQNMGAWGTATGNIFNSNGESDFYLFVLEKDGNDALFGSRLGESDNAFLGTGADHVDGGTSRFDPNGYVYQAVCASCGGSDNFPTTPGAYSGQNRSSNCNMAVFKIEFDLSPINAQAGFDSDSGCAPLTINFENLTNKPFVDGMTILWDFGDGTDTVDVEDPVHVYTNPGTYNGTLIVIDSSQCNTADTTEFVIVASESGAVADFSMDVSSLCDDGTVTFTNNSTNASGYTWLYGDGGTSTTSDPVHTYTYSGTGPYSVYLIANDGTPCMTDDTTFQDIPGGCCPIFESVTANDENCDRDDGSIIVSVGNSGVAPYDYSIDGGSTFIFMDAASSVTFSDLNSGTYDIVVQDANNCSIDTTITITNSGADDNVQFNETSCIPGDTGTAVITLTNASGCDSVVTTITTLVNAYLDTINLQTCDPQNAGVEIDSSTSVSGCDSITVTITEFVDFFSDTITIYDCNILQSNVDVDSLTSSVGCDSIVTTITLPAPSYDQTVNAATCIIADTGITIVTLTTQFGCDSIITTITTLSSFSIDSVDVTNADCNGADGSITVFITGATEPIEYQVVNSQGNISVLPGATGSLVAGNYTLTATDAAQCQETATFIIGADSAISVDANPESSSIYVGESVDLTAIPSGGIFQWTPPDNLSCPDCDSTTASPVTTTYYVITREVDGCFASDTIFIEVKEPSGFIPGAFTPNGDGLNDLLQIQPDFVESLEYYRIYDRWGTLVFETFDLSVGWDGSKDGTLLELDTYIYHIRMVLKTTGGPIELSGPVLLMR